MYANLESENADAMLLMCRCFCLQVEELNLDSCDASQITGLTDQYTSLETLTLSNNGLTSLKGFPNLPNLRKVM